MTTTLPNTYATPDERTMIQTRPYEYRTAGLGEAPDSEKATPPCTCPLHGRRTPL